MKATELASFLSDMLEAHGDLDICIPGTSGDLPIEGILAVLVEDFNKQYYLIADAGTIDGIDKENAQDASQLN